MKQYRVSRYTININKPINKKGTIRVAFLSDLHNADWGKNNRLLLSLIDEENPDIVLCGGDMLVAYPGEDVVKAAIFMNELADRYPTYYGYGNHEYRLKIYPETYGDMYRHYKKLLNEDKVHILDNDKIEIFVNGIELCIYGLTIKRKYYQRFKRIPMPVSEIREALGSPNKNMITILLAHTPKYMKSYFKWGVDLTLSGHYHGGFMQLSKNRGLLSPDPELIVHNAHGLITEKNRNMIVSAGLGEHTVPVRVNNPRELVVADIKLNGVTDGFSGKDYCI